MNCCWPPVRQKSPVSRPDTGWMQEQLELEVAASRFWPKDWIQTPPRGSEQVYMVPQCTDRLQPSLSWMNHICVQSAGRYVTPNANTGVRGLNEDLFSGYLNVFFVFFLFVLDGKWNVPGGTSELITVMSVICLSLCPSASDSWHSCNLTFAGRSSHRIKLTFWVLDMKL